MPPPGMKRKRMIKLINGDGDGDGDGDDGVLYCPICGHNITAININEVSQGKDGGYIFVHDNIKHTDNELQALSKGIN